MSSSPNILLVMTDQHRADGFGFAGNRHVATPHLDALAGRSTVFANHISSTPICTPARASIHTGQYARTHGAFHVGYTLDRDAPTLARTLGEAGYTCGLFGKSHLEPELSEFAATLPETGDYYGFKRTLLSEDNLIGPYMRWLEREHPQWVETAWVQANEEKQRPPVGYDPAGTTLDAVAPNPLPFELSQSSWIADRTVEFIDERGASGSPFFAVCSFVPPHHPWTPPEPFASMVDPDELPTPTRLPDDYVFPCPVSAYMHMPNLSDGELRRMMAAYYGSINMLDVCIGRVLDALARSGADENTIVIFTSDHGDYNGDFGLIRKGGPMFDCLPRVALLVHVPASMRDGAADASAGSSGLAMSDALTQHEDLMPTLLDLLGMDGPGTMQGVSFASELRGPRAGTGGDAPVRRFAPIELLTAEGGQAVRGGTDGRWKLLHYSGGARVLVNPAEDPMEQHNRYDDPALADVRRSLESQLLEWMTTTPQRLPAKSHKW